MPSTDASGSVVAAYDALADAGTIAPDDHQRAVALALDQLAGELASRRPARRGGPLGWMLGRKRDSAEAPRGLYVWGGVGRGKTMLMDLFFERAPVERKRRQHFHVFMADVHRRVFAARQEGGSAGTTDPVEVVAAEIADEIELICFDEFTVTDIADAMILGRLFTRLFQRGLVLVATSNVVPDRLYEDGINRQHLLPFIRLLKERTAVIELAAPTDYRLRQLRQSAIYFSPLGAGATAAMDALWQRHTGGETALPRNLPVAGRMVEIPAAVGRSGRASFSELCERPLGPRDYQAIAEAFDTLFLDDVPEMGVDRRNEAKRFITLVDTLYDAGVKLVLSAAGEPASLYVADHGTEAFEFNRTASRLTEMRSAAYLAQPRRDMSMSTGIVFG